MRTTRGEAEYKRWRHNVALTPQEAIAAHCFICNNREDAPCSAGSRCALYGFSLFLSERDDKRAR